MAFFLTTPKSNRRPRPEKMLTVWCDQKRENAERDRKRQRQQDRDGVDERLELRGQDHVHEDERQGEGEQEVVARTPQLFRAAGTSRRITRRSGERRGGEEGRSRWE